MTDAIIAGLVAVAAIAGASFVGGWHMGSSGPTKRLAGLEAVVADQALRAQGARDDAQRAIDQLTARALEAETRAPSVEYRDVNEAPKVEISRRLLEPIRPLPALPVDSFLLPDSGTGPPGPPSSIDAKQGQRTH